MRLTKILKVAQAFIGELLAKLQPRILCRIVNVSFRWQEIEEYRPECL